MPISVYQGDTGRPVQFQLSYADGTKPNLSGFGNANFTLHLYNAAGPTTIVCAGNFSVVDGVNGKVNYSPLSSEVATIANYQAWLTVHFPAGDVTWTPDTINVLQKF